MLALMTKFGNPAKNQYVIFSNDKAIFYSYETAIAAIEMSTGKTFLNGSYWDYSATTRNYFWQFCRKFNSELTGKTTQGLRKVQEQYQV